MRRFLNFKREQSIESQVKPPSLPLDISYPQLIHMTKRGFIAIKLVDYLGMDPVLKNIVYFLSLSKMDIDNVIENEPDQQLVYYGETLLRWIDDRKNIREMVDALSVNDQVKNAILKVYDIHKQYLMDEQVKEQAPSTIDTNEKWSVYRDVMFSATQGKFLLISEEDLDANKKGHILIEKEIKVLSDIPGCREAVKAILEQQGYNKSTLMSWLLVISEAITNTLKHAEEGRMVLLEDKESNEIKVLVEDKGPGFDLEQLPKKTLMAGYSTKKSLGQGFQLMLKMTKQVLLYSSDHGSTIILKFDARNGEM